MRRALAAAVAASLVTTPLAASAAPGDRTTRLVSTGGANLLAEFGGASADGSRVYFTTTEAIPGTGDAGEIKDVFERRPDGSLRRVSGGAVAATFSGASAGGAFAWYAQPGVAPAGASLLERTAAGAGRVVAAAAAGEQVVLVGASADGRTVWFERRNLDGAPVESQFRRLFAATAAGTAKISHEAAIGAFAGATADGSRVWYESDGPAVDDVDGAKDVFERRADGSLRLISAGVARSGFGASFAGATEDGSRVWYATREAIPGTGDTDGSLDIYERAADGATRLVTVGTPTADARFVGASADGSRIWIETSQAIAGTGDADAAVDVYELRPTGTPRLLTGGTAATDARFLHGSTSGDRVAFRSTEPLLGETGAAIRIYERRADGSLLRLSHGAVDADYRGASRDGSRVWYTTTAPLPGADADGSLDVFEAGPGGVQLISGGVADVAARYVGASPDGARVWFRTTEALPGTGDSDVAQDVYERTWGAPVMAARPVLTGAARLGARLTCNATVAGEGVVLARTWRRFGTPIPGATGATYVVTPADAATQLSCRVVASNPIGGASGDSAAIEVPAAPSFAARARIVGAPVLGTSLRCGALVRNATSRTTTWRRNGRIVSRAARYRVRGVDLGQRLACALAATGPGGTRRSVAQLLPVPRLCRPVDVRGRTLAAARTALGLRGCRVRVRRVAGEGVAPGRALGTSPGVGESGPNGTLVTLRVRR